ncbi:hypothetical protein FHU10_2526 [Serratia fonticola]|uniref:Uncharacterized protein n=1 Tax=Serratia fonticola TaxID=47917 RepID=A0A542BV66_SERFO|nr:hypothetical protein [Serratia fonticola]TQI82496.1 hypothetical protein FHU09_5183 [Serratia fonticola]TQI95485.1 hypothetical protein FHU11_0867 [Serratia fonticola]TVZ69980.1 hypothetical protein FHU10_2526 [Serratia fonticola]
MLMSKAAYAKHRGVSRQTVYDWIAKNEVVMSGTKIDVEATERQRQGSDNPGPEDTTTNPWAHRKLEMTWGDFWKAVQAKDGKVPRPTTDESIEQRVRHAADELNWSVEFLEDEGIYLDDGDTVHYFQQYNLMQNAELAIGLLRREVCYVAAQCTNDLDDWSSEGLRALAEWDR